MTINLSTSQKIIHLRSSGGTPAISNLSHSCLINIEEIWPAGPSSPIHVFTFDQEPLDFIFIDRIDQSITAAVIGSASIISSGLNLQDNAVVEFSEQILPAGDASLVMRIRVDNSNKKVLFANFDGSEEVSGSALIASGVAIYEHKESGAVVTGTTSIADSQYHTIVVTKEGFGDLNLFVDSNTSEDTAVSLDTIESPDLPLLGSYTQTTASEEMFIRELVIFDRVLNSFEIQQIVNYYT